MNRKERREKGAGPTGGGNLAALLRRARELVVKGALAEAHFLYEQILKDDPDNAGALLDLGVAALERKDIAAAAPLLEKAARLSPENPWALMALAVVKMEQRDGDAALALCEKAEKLDPSAEALTKLGLFYKETGYLDRAASCLRKAVDKKPELVMAWFNLRDLKKFSPADPDLDRLDAVVAKSGALPARQQAQLQFVLGKAWLDAGDTDRAFDHYAKANAMKRGAVAYDIANFEQYIENIIAHFDENAVRRLRHMAASGSERPIFIVGMPRSGSTLVDQILASHPAAASIGESRAFQDAVPVVPNAEVRAGYFSAQTASISKRFIEQLAPDVFGDIATKYLAANEVNDAARVVDKMLFNFVWTGLIRLAFPKARIIHCARDPLDMGLSIWRMHFAGNVPWAYDQKDIGRYYHAYQRLMAHWHRLFPGEIYDLSYEAMVADQEAETRKLLEYCGLPWDERCLNFYAAGRRISTASFVQVRKPVYKDSVGSGRKYAKYLQALIETLEAAR